jgi:hypothetical protein
MRRFLQSTVIAAVLLGSTTLLCAAVTEPEAASISTMFLELDGSVVGPLVACKVNIQDFSYVVSNKRLSKTIDTLQYPQITFQIDAAMGKPMYDWIKASVSGGGGGGGGARKSGSIIYADFNYKELARISFQNALITEVGMPKLDAASSAPGVITVTLEPESTSRTFPSKPNQLAKPKQKAWLCSNFRLELGGLRLSDDALGCTQPPMINPVYESPTAQVASVIFNPREYSLFAEWQQALYCSGLPPEANERAFTITYLGPDGATLFTTSFISSGLFKLTPNADAAGEVVSYTALLYVGGGATFDAAP